MDNRNYEAALRLSPNIVIGLSTVSAAAGAFVVYFGLSVMGPLRYAVIGMSLVAVVASTACSFVAVAALAGREGESEASSTVENVEMLEAATSAEAEPKERDIMTALNSVPDAVVAMDKNSRITFMNTAAAALSGCDAANASGQLADMLFPLKKMSDDAAFPSPALKSLKSAFVTRPSDLARITGAHGRAKTVRPSAFPLYDDDGNVTGAIMLLRVETGSWPQNPTIAINPIAEPLPILSSLSDIEPLSAAADTECENWSDQLHAVEDTLRIERERAQESLATQSALLASISDELRTPLHTVIGYCEMVEEEIVGTNAVSLIPDIQKIRSAGSELLSLVNDMLNLSKLTSGEIEMFIQSFDVKTLVDDVVTALLPVLNGGGNRVEINCAADAGTMNTDPTKLRQCLFTLLLAASRNRTKRTIIIDVTREMAGASPAARFRVSDAGLGLGATDDNVPPISEGISRRAESLSLSIAITQTLCRMMKGSVTVGIVPGVGRSVSLRLPADIATVG